MKLALRPRITAVAALVLTATMSVLAQQPKESTADAGLSPDEKQIRQAVIDFMQRYNAHKPAEVAALFAPDARMVFRDGTEVDGREAIKQSFEGAFRESPKAAVSVVVDSIRFLTSDVAVEEGATSLFPDGETLAARSRYTVLHLKKNGKWQMQSVRVVEEETLSAYDQLQSLEWMIGEWIDEGADEVVEAKFSWDDNKSFLIEEFQVIREEAVLMKGTQRIGWDPQAKQVRSWIFDNASGYGSSTWTPVGDAWVCKVNGVRPDGSAASATRTLVREGPDRVIWRATDRLDGDEQLPDLTVTMVRKPPQPQ